MKKMIILECRSCEDEFVRRGEYQRYCKACEILEMSIREETPLLTLENAKYEEIRDPFLRPDPKSENLNKAIKLFISRGGHIKRVLYEPPGATPSKFSMLEEFDEMIF
jgi:hypothetical protein